MMHNPSLFGETFMQDELPPPSVGNALLFRLIGVISGVVFLVFLILLTNGWFLWMILAVFGVGGLGFLHYWTWGRSMMLETEAEREKAERKAESERRW